MTFRDPRIDPRTGDSVTVAGETREVERVSPAHDTVIYSWPGKLAMRTLRMSAWRSWAAASGDYQAKE